MANRFSPAACPFVLVVLPLIMSLGSPCPVSAFDEPPIAAPVADADWDRAFTRTSGWTGGDVAGTIDLGDGRTLWVFGDSWIGDVVDGMHAPPSRLVNNAIAVHSTPKEKPWLPSADLEFYWGPKDAEGHPSAWIVPVLPKPNNEANTPAKSHWYWPTGGGVVIPGADGSRRLVLFLFRVERGNAPKSVMNFEVVGTSIALVNRIDQPIEKWQPRVIDLPDAATHFADPRGEGDNAQKSVAPSLVHWGKAALQLSNASKEESNFIYIYGIKTGKLLNPMVVARVAADNIERFDAWRFYDANGGWSERIDDAKSVAEALVSEFSVEQLNRDGRNDFLLVQSEPLFGRRIYARTSPSPGGPWTKPTPIYTIPPFADDGRKLITYAAKGHARLSRPREILVTYVVNSFKFSEIVNDATLYRPRFIRIPLRDTMPR